MSSAPQWKYRNLLPAHSAGVVECRRWPIAPTMSNLRLLK